MDDSESCRLPVKSENLKIRVLLPFSLALAILLGAFVAGVCWTKDRHIRAGLARETAWVGEHVNPRLREDSEKPAAVMEGLAGDHRPIDTLLSDEIAACNRLILAGAVLGLGVWSALFILFYIVLNRAEQRQRADLADRAEAEAAVKTHLKLLDVFLNTIPNPVYHKDAAGVFRGCNETFARQIFGKPREQVLGCHVSDFADAVTQKQKEFHHEQDMRLLGNPGIQFDEVAIDCADGVRRDFFISRATVRDSAGNPAGVVGVMTNISDRKKTEEQLRKSHDQLIDALRREKRISMSLEATMEQLKATTDVAQAATRAKSEFLANISHEIRTPMTAILGFAENLLDAGMSESERVTAAQIIRSNGEHLLQILNDILDISKIEAGRLQIENIKCSPIHLIQEVLSLMKVRSDAKGLSLQTEYAGPIPETIHTDSTRLRQILINLVGNAVKFTEVGSVRLVVSMLRMQADRPMMAFDIVDTGVGLTQEQIGRLFRPFTQGDGSTTRTHGGTGLGLTISKRLAEVLGGAITVRSQPGMGSTFRLTIATGSLEGVPLIEHPSDVQSADQQKHDASSKDLRLSVPILLAEDGPDNQRLISYMLKKAGADVAVADNGQDAVSMVLDAHHRNEPYALVLMDMQMPVMDGYEATRQLRAHGYDRPIIALTAHAMAGDRDKCLSAGCSDYAAKPIDRASLLRLIQQHLDMAAVPCPA